MALPLWDPIKGFVGMQGPTQQVGPTGTRVAVDPGIYKTPTYPSYTAGPQGQRVPYDPGLYRPSTGATRYYTTPDQVRAVLKAGQTIGWQRGRGYYVKGTAHQPAAPADDPWTALYKKIMSTYETPDQQEARVNREVDAQIAAQKKLLDDEYARQVADANAQAAAMNAAGMAAAGMSKDLLDQVGGEYNIGAQEIAGLAHGLSGMIGAGTAADVSKDNQGLARVGAPALTEGGKTGYGGATQQAVENYRGGTLGSQLLTGEGQAESFGLAGMTAAQTLQAQQTAQAGLMTAMHDIRANQAKAIDALAAGRGDLYHSYMADAQDAQIKYLSLAQGIMAQQQASATAGAKAPITRTFGNTLLQWNGKRWVVAATKPGAPAKPPTPPKTFGSAATGIYTWVRTKTGWKSQLVVPPTASKGQAVKPPATHNLPNGDLAVWQQQKDGSWKLVTIASKGNDPNKPTINGPGGAPMTNKQINDAGTTVSKSITSAVAKGIPIETVIDRFDSEGIPAEIYMPIVMQRYQIPRHFKDLRFMPVQTLRRLAVVLGWRPTAAPYTPGSNRTAGQMSKQDFLLWLLQRMPQGM